jgi:thiosulfate/3-mercaptopyruvate sulfurtransferase
MQAPSPLVCAADLRAALAQPSLLLLDASFELSDPSAGERAYAQGHLPGARYVHLERDLSAPKAAPGPGFTGRHPLPERAAFAATVGRWGVAPGTCVVAMDRQEGVYAARLWWMLRWLGHARVWVLDGGVRAWTAAGGALGVEPAAEIAPRPPYPLRRGASMPTVSANEVGRELGLASIVDARAGERFRGEVEPLDRVAGHVPGALNRPFKSNLDASGCFKAAPQLAREFANLLGGAAAADGRVIHLCGSGVTACHNLLAMAAAGLAAGRLYPGSWSEWSADPARPVARGG